MGSILSFGSLNLDYVYQIPHFVTAGETLASTQRQVHCGGKGLNQSIAAARAGAKVYHAGKIGAEGTMLKEVLAQNGVDTTLVYQGTVPTGHAIIQVNPQGQNCILLYGGSNQDLKMGEIAAAFANFGTGDILLLQNEVNGLGQMIELAYDKGMDVVFNPSPMTESLLSLPLHRLSLLVLNEVEAAALTKLTQPREMMDCLREKFPQCAMLMTLGSDGALYDDGEIALSHGIYGVTTVDTTAAGDTFTGFFLACRTQGMDVATALDYSARGAALAVSRAGASPSIPTMKEVFATYGTAFDDLYQA